MIALLAAVFLGMWIAAHLLEKRDYGQAHSLARYGLIAAFTLFFILHWADAPAVAPDVAMSSWIAPGGAAFAAIVVLLALATKERALSALDIVAAFAFTAASLIYPIAVVYGGEDRLDLPYTALLGVFIVWGIAHGARTDDRLIVNLGFAGFAAWTLYLYADYFSSLFDQAAFFAVGGLLLLGMGVVLEMARRRVIRHTGAN
jgi:uncharacterized membrane protein